MIQSNLPDVAQLSLSSMCRILANTMPRKRLLHGVLLYPLSHYDFHSLGERDGKVESRYACDHCRMVHKASKFPESMARLREAREEGPRICKAALAEVEIFPGFHCRQDDIRQLFAWVLQSQRPDQAYWIRIVIAQILGIARSKRCSVLEAFGLYIVGPQEYSTLEEPSAAHILWLYICHGEFFVSVDYRFYLGGLECSREPELAQLQHELLKPTNAIVACPHFGSYELREISFQKIKTALAEISGKVPLLTKSMSCPVYHYSGARVVCKHCSCKINFQLSRTYSSIAPTIKHVTSLQVSVVRDLGDPYHVDNELWIKQIPDSTLQNPKGPRAQFHPKDATESQVT